MSGDTLISVGSPTTTFPQNKQNEPALAVDPIDPNVLVGGANDEIDLAPAVGSSAPFTEGVGVSGVYFSTNGGATWTQPTYTGWSARTGTSGVGPIGTLPGYYENGLVSDGDPTLAFGPRPDAQGRFSWDNGSRLYYANLTSNFSSVRSEGAFLGSEAIAVSRTDHTSAAAAGDQSAWMSPVIVSRQNASLFSDKEQLWVDNAASSPFFGNVYVANVAFGGGGKGLTGPEPIMFARSTDGGETWNQKQITQAASTTGAGLSGGRQGATIRTDSKGTVYVFWDGSLNGQGVQFMTRSFDGGKTFERPRAVATVTEVGAFDSVSGRFTFDGVAGARTDSFPSVDIANGAPAGVGATNEIVMTWADARSGLNHEQALVQYSTDGGNTWSSPVNAAPAADRPDFPAIAISPNGQDAYLTYDNFLSPWQSDTSNPRPMQGVVRHVDIGTGGVPGTWSDQDRGPTGDARGSSANSLVAEFLGDYNAIVATNTYGAAAWNDVRNAADSPAIDAYRQSLVNGSPGTPPNLDDPTEVPPTFGNSDIYGGVFVDPTPNSTPSSAIAAPLVIDPGFASSGISPSAAIAPVLVPIPDASSEVQSVTPRARKRSTPSPAMDVH